MFDPHIENISIYGGRSSLTNEKDHHYFMNKFHVCR